MSSSVKPALNVQGLAKAYGSVRALDGVSFRIGEGSIVALLGPNGAGKTTTLKCVLGITDFEGDVEVDGVSVKRQGKEVRRRIGYLPQSLSLEDRDSCRDALEFLADLRGADRCRIIPLLDLVNLREQRDVEVGHLSGGMRQRLALAAALVSDPPLLLLDEPTASLDVESRREFHELILRLREEGKTVLLSTHFLDHLGELADRCIVLHRGRLAFDGTLSELAERSRSKRYVVNLNGSRPGELMEALRKAGIGPEGVRLADPQWEELILSLAEERT